MKDLTNEFEKAPGESVGAEMESEAVALYLRLKSLATGKKAFPLSRDAKLRKKKAGENTQNTPFTPGRDPLDLGEALGSLTRELGWDSSLSQADVLVNWAQLVGPDIAAHTQAVEITDETLIIRCESTAWATQLRLIRGDILTKIAREVPASKISAIKFQGPDAPSWKRGPRSIPGRGPRDTYG